MTDEPKMPSRHDVDVAREELERWQFKLGKVEARAIESASTAKADEIELKAVRDKVEEARTTYTALVDRFTHHDRIQEATAAIRARLAPEMAQAPRLIPGAVQTHPEAETMAQRPASFADGDADSGEADYDEQGDLR